MAVVLLDRDPSFQPGPDLLMPGELMRDPNYWGEISHSAETFGVDDVVAAHEQARQTLLELDFEPDQDPADCSQLLAYAETLIGPHIETGEHRDIVHKTLFLLEKLYQYHPNLAREGVEVAELAAQIANNVDDLTGAQRDRVLLWSSALLHDVGNIMLPIELIHQSEAGKVWTETEMAQKRLHSLWGRMLAQMAGLPSIVGRVVYANHAKQTSSPPYGMDIELYEGDERSNRDAVAAADCGLAKMTRNNEANLALSLEDRINAIYVDDGWRFNDYWHIDGRNNPNEIVSTVVDTISDYVAANYVFVPNREGLGARRRHRIGRLGSAAVDTA